MSNEIARYSEETFESIKHVNEYGNEFWYASGHDWFPSFSHVSSDQWKH